MPYKKLLILTSLTIVLVAFVFLTRPSQAETTGLANTMNTLKLTYPGVTFYSSERTPILLAGNSGAHVIWEEEVALPNETDLFYAHLPTGTVTRLTDLASTNGATNGVDAFLGNADDLNVLWDEDTGTNEGYDLFFWKTGNTAALHLSDQTLSEGDVFGFSGVVDSANLVHVLWAEEDSVGSDEGTIYYWSEAAGSIQPLSSGVTLGSVALRIYDNVLHGFWLQLRDGSATEPEVVYWNSTTGLVEPVRDSASPPVSNSFINFGHVHMDDSGVSHLIWNDQSSGSVSFVYWNSSSKTNVPISGTFLQGGTLRDGNNNFYFYYEQSGDVNLFNSIDESAGVIPGLPTTNSHHLVEAVDGRIGNHVHFLWHVEDSNHPGDLRDLFYWRSDMVEPINITDHDFAPADPENVRIVVDATDIAHVMWEESGNHYYNSSSNTTIQLPSSLDSVTDGYGYMVARDGVAYGLFGLLKTSPFYIWQSDTNSVTIVNHPLGSTSDSLDSAANSESSSIYIWLDALNRLHLTNSTPWHWDAANGMQDLTAAPEIKPVHELGYIWTAQDAEGGSYIVWQGGDNADAQQELFAAYTVSSNLENKLFLPLLTR